MAPPPKRRRRTPASNATATASVDRFLRSALAMADPSASIGLSLERIHDSSPLQFNKESLFDGATRAASAFMAAACKFAAAHNSFAWPLPADLTIKVFSMLDTESVCRAATTCILFGKCASDPLCYANIDLTKSEAKVSNKVVTTMIQRAGKNLQSIKLGRVPQDKKTFKKSPLTGSCLSALVLDGGTAGLLLRHLHLYGLKCKFRDYNLFSALAACQSLIELEIVGVNVLLDSILETISERCHSIERLCLDIRAICKSESLFDLEDSGLKTLIKKCPLLSSLALRGYQIEDDLLFFLIKGACGIKSLDISGSYGFHGFFLGDLSDKGGTDSLETLILRDCEQLGAKKVSDFLSAILDGDWKALRYVDVSNSRGLDAIMNPPFCRTRIRCGLDVSEFSEERPDIHLIADYPEELCFYNDVCTCSPSPSSRSDASLSSSDCSYSSDAASSSALSSCSNSGIDSSSDYEDGF